MMIKNKTKKAVTMIEANEVELSVRQNTVDILLIKKDLKEIKNNHLKHIEEDIKKIDGRLWWIMGLILVSLIGTIVPGLYT